MKKIVFFSLMFLFPWLTFASTLPETLQTFAKEHQLAMEVRPGTGGNSQSYIFSKISLTSFLKLTKTLKSVPNFSKFEMNARVDDPSLYDAVVEVQGKPVEPFPASILDAQKGILSQQVKIESESATSQTLQLRGVAVSFGRADDYKEKLRKLNIFEPSEVNSALKSAHGDVKFTMTVEPGTKIDVSMKEFPKPKHGLKEPNTPIGETYIQTVAQKNGIEPKINFLRSLDCNANPTQATYKIEFLEVTQGQVEKFQKALAQGHPELKFEIKNPNTPCPMLLISSPCE